MIGLRVLGAAGRAFITTGIVILLFVAYQLWGTGLAESRAQGQLEDDFEELLARVGDGVAGGGVAGGGVAGGGEPTATSTPSEPPTTPPLDLDLDLDLSLLETLYRDGGEVTARIEIPGIEVDKLVVEGVQVADLRKGPGHYRATPLPGQEGNASIAGHRTTYGAPFHDIDQLSPGDEIIVTTVQGTYTYEIADPSVAYADRLDDLEGLDDGHVIVRPDATWVLDDFGDNRLTLTACHPKYSARQRIIVTAMLVDEPAFTPDLERIGEIELQGEELPEAVDRSRFLDEVSLDEGLDGQSSALWPALIWGLVTMALWAATRVGAWKWRSWPAYAIGALPVAACLWLCFEQVDRLLPAY